MAERADEAGSAGRKKDRIPKYLAELAKRKAATLANGRAPCEVLEDSDDEAEQAKAKQAKAKQAKAKQATAEQAKAEKGAKDKQANDVIDLCMSDEDDEVCMSDEDDEDDDDKEVIAGQGKDDTDSDSADSDCSKLLCFSTCVRSTHERTDADMDTDMGMDADRPRRRRHIRQALSHARHAFQTCSIRAYVCIHTTYRQTDNLRRARA